MRLAHKALDIPDPEMDIQANKTVNSGMGWKEMAVVGAMMAGTAGGMAAWMQPPSPTPPVAPPAVVAPAEPQMQPLRGKIRFWTDDGTQLGEQETP